LRELGISKKQFDALLEKAENENLPLRTKQKWNSYKERYFIAYSLEGLKDLRETKPKPEPP
jgi:hypothetical protein